MKPPVAKPAGPETRALQVVPPSGPTAWLTIFTAGAMTFLCVFALALSLASGRLADRWSEALARTATIRLSAPSGQEQIQADAILAVLATTPGIASFRAIDAAETRALLEPWFGPGLPVEVLPIPRLFEVVEAAPPYDSEGLRQRLKVEAPGALLDDHTRWRRPLIEAAGRIRLLGVLSIALIGATMAAMITLAARAALATNAEAKDSYIARAFVRRFTLRTLAGAAVGTAAGIAGVAALPAADAAGGFLTGLGFTGPGWLWPLVLPPAAALVAFLATRRAAFAKLRDLT